MRIISSKSQPTITVQTLIDQGLLDKAILVQKLKGGTKSNYYYVKTRPNKDRWNKLDLLQMIFGRKKHVYIWADSSLPQKAQTTLKM